MPDVNKGRPEVLVNGAKLIHCGARWVSICCAKWEGMNLSIRDLACLIFLSFVRFRDRWRGPRGALGTQMNSGLWIRTFEVLIGFAILHWAYLSTNFWLQMTKCCMTCGSASVSMRNGVASVAVVVECCDAWRWRFESDCCRIDCTGNHPCQNLLSDRLAYSMDTLWITLWINLWITLWILCGYSMDNLWMIYGYSMSTLWITLWMAL